MKIDAKCVELPYAVQHKPGYTDSASGLYFHFYRTEAEAKKTLSWLRHKKKWNTGKIDYMPGHARSLGWVSL